MWTILSTCVDKNLLFWWPFEQHLSCQRPTWLDRRMMCPMNPLRCPWGIFLVSPSPSILPFSLSSLSSQSRKIHRNKNPSSNNWWQKVEDIVRSEMKSKQEQQRTNDKKTNLQQPTWSRRGWQASPFSVVWALFRTDVMHCSTWVCRKLLCGCCWTRSCRRNRRTVMKLRDNQCKLWGLSLLTYLQPRQNALAFISATYRQHLQCLNLG